MNPSFRENNAAARPKAVPAPIRNPVSLVLLWASKTDPRLLSLCSRWAMSTQTAFGVFVFFTAALALGGSYYTLSTINTPSAQPSGSPSAWFARFSHSPLALLWRSL